MISDIQNQVGIKNAEVTNFDYSMSLYRVNKFCFQVAMVVISKKVFNQAVDKKREVL